MNRSRSLLLAAVAAAALVSPLRAVPEPEAAAGRELLKKYADAVIGIELVVTVKAKAGDRELPPREVRVETNGTVISASGLTVTSLARVDPQAQTDIVGRGGRGGAEITGADFKEVKLRFADGKEVPARFVLKDADLDLAFMAPVAEEGKKIDFPSYVKLEDATDGTMLTTYYYVSRATKALQRVPLIRGGDIMGIVEKPRRFFLLTDVALGAPMFDAKGKILGVTVQNFAGGQPTGLVVLPARDIAEMAKQAAAAQAAPPPAAAQATPPPAAEPKKEN